MRGINPVESEGKMENLKLKKAFELIEKYRKPNDYISGSKSDEQIKHMEKILNVTLPPSYKEFIKKYGSGGIGSKDFFGIDKNVEESESVTTTLDKRNYELPLKYVIITNDEDGSYCAIDCSKKINMGKVLLFGGHLSLRKKRLQTILGNLYSLILKIC